MSLIQKESQSEKSNEEITIYFDKKHSESEEYNNKQNESHDIKKSNENYSDYAEQSSTYNDDIGEKKDYDKIKTNDQNSDSKEYTTASYSTSTSYSIPYDKIYSFHKVSSNSNKKSYYHLGFNNKKEMNNDDNYHVEEKPFNKKTANDRRRNKISSKKTKKTETDYNGNQKSMNHRFYNKPKFSHKNYRNKFQSRPNLGRFRYQKRKLRKNFVN